MEAVLKYFPNLSDQQKQQFKLFRDVFLDWNDKVNLISRKDTDEFYTRHVLHSLAIAKFVNFIPGTQIMDLGTGGGLPGLPLAILFPEVQFYLVDSIGKKIRAVQDMAEQVGLKNVRAEQIRCEEVKEQFDFVVSRAVAPVGKIHGWVRHVVTDHHTNAINNGYILLKGGDLTEEIKESNLKVKQTNISKYYQEEFFETKKIVYVRKK